MKSLYHYFKHNSLLPSPTGPLSKEVPATAISAVNKEVMECLKHSEDEKGVKKRGNYQKYSRNVNADRKLCSGEWNECCNSPFLKQIFRFKVHNCV